MSNSSATASNATGRSDRQHRPGFPHPHSGKFTPAQQERIYNELKEFFYGNGIGGPTKCICDMLDFTLQQEELVEEYRNDLTYEAMRIIRLLSTLADQVIH